MSGWGLVAALVLLCAAFPFCFAFFRRPVRLVLSYVYVAMVLLVGGFFGSVLAIPLTGAVTLSAGSILYGALMLTAFLLVAGGHDPRVIRNLVKIVVAVNVFKVLLFTLTAEALRTPGVVNPFGVVPEVFTVSLTVVLVGGVLIVAELALIAVVLEAVQSRVRSRGTQAALQVLLFVAVLVLDGVLFPVLARPTAPDLGALVAGGGRRSSCSPSPTRCRCCSSSPSTVAGAGRRSASRSGSPSSSSPRGATCSTRCSVSTARSRPAPSATGGSSSRPGMPSSRSRPRAR